MNQRHPGERAAGATPVFEVLKRDAEVPPARIMGINPHDPIRPIKRQPTQENGVDQREDGAVGANAEGERGDCGEREPPVLD